jgi:hypothetical protein
MIFLGCSRQNWKWIIIIIIIIIIILIILLWDDDIPNQIRKESTGSLGI